MPGANVRRRGTGSPGPTGIGDGHGWRRVASDRSPGGRPHRVSLRRPWMASRRERPVAWRATSLRQPATAMDGVAGVKHVAIRFPPQCRGVVDAESSLIRKPGWPRIPGHVIRADATGVTTDGCTRNRNQLFQPPTSLVKSSPAWVGASRTWQKTYRLTLLSPAGRWPASRRACRGCRAPSPSCSARRPSPPSGDRRRWARSPRSAAPAACWAGRRGRGRCRRAGP